MAFWLIKMRSQRFLPENYIAYGLVEGFYTGGSVNGVKLIHSGVVSKGGSVKLGG